MDNYIKKRIFKKIEYYLYNYDYIDIKIQNAKMEILNSEYNQNYYKWLKNQSSSLENQVIKNIEIEQKIYRMKKWKKLIEAILKRYQNTNILYYNFINLKYFQRATLYTIQQKLRLNEEEQKDIQTKIVQYIFFAAVRNKMLRIG
ncbi:MAG: hypothetical protein HFJ29_04145 [Clostridia bacterium]|nr:hypothetical protein [Clostridia bacterium]